MLLLITGCAAAPIASAPVVEEKEPPTYEHCVWICEQPGWRPVGIYRGECCCAPWDA